MDSTHKLASAAELHGYQPVVVDESFLSAAQRRESFENYIRANTNGQNLEDWREYLTPGELAELKNKENIRVIGKDEYGLILDRNDRVKLDKLVAELTRLCWQRRYAREKYNQGRGVWFGDGVPPWLRS